MKEKNLLYSILRSIVTFLIRLIYRTKSYAKENIPKQGSFILAGNHKHAFDPFLAVANTKRLVHFYAKEEVSGGFHGFLMRKVGNKQISYKEKEKKQL